MGVNIRNASPAGRIKIGSTILSNTASSITSPTIPPGFAGLSFNGSLRTDRASNTSDLVDIAFNSDTVAANYDREVLTTLGSVFSANTRGLLVATAATATTDHFMSFTASLPAYASSNMKTVLAQLLYIDTAGSSGFGGLRGLVWKNTSPITLVTLTPNLGTNFIAGCRVDWYLDI